MKSDKQKVEKLLRAIHCYADQQAYSLGIRLVSDNEMNHIPVTKIKDRELTNAINNIKHMAVKKNKYEFAVELRKLEIKYFGLKKYK